MESTLKRWVLSWPWVKEAKIEAFRLANKDILDTMQDDLDAKAEELAREKVAALLSYPDLRTIASRDRNKIIFIGGQPADEGRIANLKAEAAFFLESDLWKLLYETPKQLAHHAMFVDPGDVQTQLLKGRAILYTLDTQKNIVELFRP